MSLYQNLSQQNATLNLIHRYDQSEINMRHFVTSNDNEIVMIFFLQTNIVKKKLFNAYLIGLDRQND